MSFSSTPAHPASTTASPGRRPILPQEKGTHHAVAAQLLSLQALQQRGPPGALASRAPGQGADLPVLGMWFTRAGFSSSTGWSRPESPSGGQKKHLASETTHDATTTPLTQPAPSTSSEQGRRGVHTLGGGGFNPITGCFHLLNQKIQILHGITHTVPQ